MMNRFKRASRAGLVGVTAAALALTAAPAAFAATPAAAATPATAAAETGAGAEVGASTALATPRLEALDRGLVAAPTTDGVFLSWRLLKSEAYGASETGLTGADFAVYRDGTKIADVTDSTNLRDPDGTAASAYTVAPVLGGHEGPQSEKATTLTSRDAGEAGKAGDAVASIPLTKPADGVTPADEAYTYSASDTSVADVDGDGAYEFIVKWEPSNSKDVSQVGYTGTVFLDTYELDGTLLNRIDLGVNIRAGAHYTQFMVYDFDGDGRAELMTKTAPGTKSTGFGADGEVTNDAFVTLPEADIAAGVSNDDDYRLSAADYADHLVEVFRGWSTRPEVVDGTWPATLEEAFGIPVTHQYPLSEADARELVDHFLDVYAPSRSARNALRNFEGFILDGPEYLTVFDGATGAELQTIPYEPGRTDDGLLWGDYAMARIEPGNRVDRFLAGVAYLDGEHPSAVFARGYYTRTTVAAWDWDGENLSQRFLVDSGFTPMTNPFNDSPHGREGTSEEWGRLTTQGFHSLSAADVDGDGRQEIVYGSATIDDDGSLLYSSYDTLPEGSAAPGTEAKLGHGDAMHVADIDPARPGLEIFTVHEGATYAPLGYALRDAATGELIYGEYSGKDTGRGMVGDIDPNTPGLETWATRLRSASGESLGAAIPGTNQSIRWSGDLTTQILNGAGDVTPTIEDWTRGRLLTGTGERTNNGTKGTANLVADVLGDWREELVLRSADSSALNIHVSTEVTTHKLYTLMHDPQYRVEVARQNTTYNQPSYTSFYLASDMSFADVPLAAPPLPVAAPGIGVDSAGVNVTWKAPASPGTSAITGYRVTLTPVGGGDPLETTVGADALRASFALATVPAGSYTAKVVAVGDAGPSAASAPSATAVVTGSQPVRLAANAKSQCVNGTAHVAVYAYNDSGRPADVRLSALGTDKKVTAVAAGKAAYSLVGSGAAAIAAGTASVTAYSFVDGVGYHSSYSVPYAALSCK
ncbi:rhamnogalacturonan lyase family protein [Herbiconiux gentiana]|uniref:rhamnogalacturonan lyase family protein n=1 Tax=Herbiconiux gentiana TaxID=2970912 RepID=UPI0035C728A8